MSAETDEERDRLRASLTWETEVLPALSFMARAMLAVPPAPPDKRCMGRSCPNEAVLLLATIDPGTAASEYPVRLCRSCCDPAIVIFRWLSDGRIEATSFGR